MKFRYFLLCGLCLLIAACGPNTEQRAAMTSTSLTAIAAAWTPTPTATSTATNTPTATATIASTQTETPNPSPTSSPTLLPTKTVTPTNTPDPNRYYAPDNSFSLIMPEGWFPDDAGSDYPGLFGPKVGNFALNIVFIRDNSDFDVFFYAALVQGDLEEKLQDLTSLREDFLTTTAGKGYFRWEITDKQNGIKYHRVFYFYESGDKKLVATYTRPDSAGSENDTLVDEAMESLRFAP